MASSSRNTGGGEVVIEGEEMGFNSQGEPSKLPGMNTGLRGSITSLGATIDIVVVDIVPPNSRKRQVSDVEKGEHNDYEGLSYEEFGASIIDQSLLESSFVKTRVRLLTYEAPNSDDSSSTTADPNSEATHLLEQLKQHRGGDHCDNVPIVLIGRRHGCLVVQELFNLINNQSEEMTFASMKEMICTVVFTQKPGPSPQDSRMPGFKIDSWNNDSTESAWMPSYDRWKDFNSMARERDVHVVSTSQGSSSEDSECYNDPVKIVSLEFSSQPTAIKVDHDSQNPGPIYRKIVDEIQTGIFLKALSDERLEALLDICVSERYCLSLQDCEKRKSLHKAVSCVYVTAVSHLLSKGPHLAGTKEKDGSTPLHRAIQKAVGDQNKRAGLESIILELIKTMEKLPVKDDLKNAKDFEDKSAWDYVNDNDVCQWISALKRRSITVNEKRATDWQELPTKSILNAPKELAKSKACKKLEATVVRFYPSENGSEEWLHRLFLKLKFNDTLMTAKRHEGIAIYDRHMIARTKRYSQNTKIARPRTRSVDDFSRKERRSIDAQIKKAPEGKAVEGQDISTSRVFRRLGGGKSRQKKETAIVLFMPILGFEQHKYLRKLKAAMNPAHNPAPEDMDETTLLVRAYFHTEKISLHCRRTLDQFTYYMLADTEKRDNDQVTFKWGKQKDEQRNGHHPDTDNESPDERQGEYPVLMVDQLWLWVLEDRRTVVTSFPNSWDSSAGYNLLQNILRDKARSRGDRHRIDSATALANLILRSSVDFMQREGPMGVSLKECFQSSISNSAEKQSTQFEEFKSLIYNLSTESSELNQKDRALMTNKLFLLVQESQNLASILDIQDELKSIRDVFKKQKEVLEKFNVLTNEGSKINEQTDQKTSKYDSSKRNLNIIDSNITSVDDMAGYAQEVHMEIQELLSLKQKQANAWEARFAREGSEHTQRQSNIMMVFTIVTIFFLPLSFMSSVFAIQVDVYPRKGASDDIAWPINQLMGLLFGISCAVILPLLIVAFSVNEISMYFRRAAGYVLTFKRPSSTANREGVPNNTDSDVYIGRRFHAPRNSISSADEYSEDHLLNIQDDIVENYNQRDPNTGDEGSAELRRTLSFGATMGAKVLSWKRDGSGRMAGR
ncbi:hypothetical protein F4806DRAFT_499305 [Annulohypoxylon nitens]|nr:hypothetical protein F4806DRAFT_499305 [Annulohypoxylon nitens]